MHTRIAPRVLPALSLALALAAQVAGLVHMGVVRHETCPDHGELVETSGDASSDHDAPGAGDTHDHCPLGTTPHVAALAPVIVTALALEASSPQHAPPTRDVVVRAVLDVAPKTSPPASA